MWICLPLATTTPMTAEPAEKYIRSRSITYPSILYYFSYFELFVAPRIVRIARSESRRTIPKPKIAVLTGSPAPPIPPRGLILLVFALISFSYNGLAVKEVLTIIQRVVVLIPHRLLEVGIS